jgi:ABC-type uncharacterized transport system permease subunit
VFWLVMGLLRQPFLFCKLLQKTHMKIFNIFKDSNDINEKTVLGFLSFGVMVAVMVADIATGWMGKDLIINEFTYNSFVYITLGSFGVAGLEKFASKK